MQTKQEFQLQNRIQSSTHIQKQFKYRNLNSKRPNRLAQLVTNIEE